MDADRSPIVPANIKLQLKMIPRGTAFAQQFQFCIRALLKPRSVLGESPHIKQEVVGPQRAADALRMAKKRFVGPSSGIRGREPPFRPGRLRSAR